MGKWGDSVVICISELIIVRYVVSYYVCCRNYMYTHTHTHTHTYIYIYIYTYPIHIQCAILYKNMDFVVVIIGPLIYSCYYI